jgi:2-iminoacetate synthase ThiH
MVEAVREGWLTRAFDDSVAPENRAAAIQLQELAEMIRELGVTPEEKAAIEELAQRKARLDKERREAETY